MTTEPAPRRLLALLAEDETGALVRLHGAGGLPGWELLHTRTFGQVRFTHQHIKCDVLLLDESLCKAGDKEVWAWLARQKQTALVVLAEDETGACTHAYAHGAVVCMPRKVIRDNGPLLAEALRRATVYGDLQREQARLQQDARDARREIDQLITRLWQTLPTDQATHWYTQRHILERLEDEVVRAGRYGCALTLAIGEFPEDDEDDPLPIPRVAERLTRAKRKCDVVGHYGPRGFLILFTHTSHQGALACCHRLREALEAPPPDEGGPVIPHFGVASYRHDGGTLLSLLCEAERHLELARGGGLLQAGGETAGAKAPAVPPSHQVLREKSPRP